MGANHEFEIIRNLSASLISVLPERTIPPPRQNSALVKHVPNLIERLIIFEQCEEKKNKPFSLPTIHHLLAPGAAGCLFVHLILIQQATKDRLFDFFILRGGIHSLWLRRHHCWHKYNGIKKTNPPARMSKITAHIVLSGCCFSGVLPIKRDPHGGRRVGIRRMPTTRWRRARDVISTININYANILHVPCKNGIHVLSNN